MLSGRSIRGRSAGHSVSVGSDRAGDEVSFHVYKTASCGGDVIDLVLKYFTQSQTIGVRQKLPPTPLAQQQRSHLLKTRQRLFSFFLKCLLGNQIRTFKCPLKSKAWKILTPILLFLLFYLTGWWGGWEGCGWCGCVLMCVLVPAHQWFHVWHSPTRECARKPLTEGTVVPSSNRSSREKASCWTIILTLTFSQCFAVSGPRWIMGCVKHSFLWINGAVTSHFVKSSETISFVGNRVRLQVAAFEYWCPAKEIFLLSTWTISLKFLSIWRYSTSIPF